MTAHRSALHVAFGARLREVRVDRGLSQEDLAAKSGLHRTYVGGIERGERNPSLMNIGRLAVALDVDLVDLMGAVGERESA
ncbi:MAG TPA: helix-turn-helix transcriptional regulator [Solirubrobacteraceae bacterium]